MARLARWCFNRRRTVLAAWAVALVAFFAIGALVGAKYDNKISVPRSGSAQAQAVLKADFPAQPGDSEQVVVEAKRGTLRSRATEAAVKAMLARVGRLPHVRSVASPYGPGGGVSADGTIGFAILNLDTSAEDVPKSAVEKLVSTARAADSPRLEVQLGGQAVEDQQQAGSSSLLIGAALALAVLFFAFRRSIFGALLPLVSALAAIGVAGSAVEVLTHALPVASSAPSIAALVALGVGVDYALFVVSRHRRALLAGKSPEEAAVTALNTSGRAVLLAGSTVCVALLGMFALQVSFLYGVAVSMALAVALTMLASLTLLPAMLGFLGPKVLRRAERERAGLGSPAPQGFWARWARLVGRAPALLGAAALGVTVLLAVPFFSLQQGFLDASTDAASSTTYQAYHLLAKGFGPGFNGPLELVGHIGARGGEPRFAAFVGTLRREPGVARVGPPLVSANGNGAVALVYPTTGPQEAATTKLLDRVRSAVPRAEAGTTLKIYVGGETALNNDFSRMLSSKMPQFVAVVVGLGFLLLALVFRSLLVPLLASVMNLLSFGAALGVITSTFQYGWGKSLLGFAQPAPVLSWLPVFMFSIVFGLSMDYEVFLVSRVHEEWTLSGDNRRAVTRGQAETGGVVTAAALIMILVFGSFMLGGQLASKQIGLGFAAAIFVDAFVIRTVVVPAAMHLMGRANWWLPAWLGRALPEAHVEAADLIEAQSSGRALLEVDVEARHVVDLRPPASPFPVGAETADPFEEATPCQ